MFKQPERRTIDFIDKAKMCDKKTENKRFAKRKETNSYRLEETQSRKGRTTELVSFKLKTKSNPAVCQLPMKQVGK